MGVKELLRKFRFIRKNEKEVGTRLESVRLDSNESELEASLCHY